MAFSWSQRYGYGASATAPPPSATISLSRASALRSTASGRTEDAGGAEVSLKYDFSSAWQVPRTAGALALSKALAAACGASAAARFLGLGPRGACTCVSWTPPTAWPSPKRPARSARFRTSSPSSSPSASSGRRFRFFGALASAALAMAFSSCAPFPFVRGAFAYRAMSGGRPRSGKTAKPSDSASACDMACSASAWLENLTMPRQVDGLLGDGFAPFFRSTVHATIVP